MSKPKQIFVDPMEFKLMPEAEAVNILSGGNDIIINPRIKSRYDMTITTSLENARSYSNEVMLYLERHPDLAVYIHGYKKAS